jgi:pimeloyl-ACP methyl ester carboxylesterase/class 3 adenylate cyclase
MASETANPTTQYAESDGLSIAYQVFGSGTKDLVLIPGILTHLELNWEYPAYARMLRRLGQTFRVIMFDKRGQGLSDRFEGVPTLEERMDDVRDVMKAAGSRRAVLLALSEGGPMAAVFAATFPEMVERLVLYGSMARFTKAEDYPYRPSLKQILDWTAAYWAKPESMRLWAPDRADDFRYCEFGARYQRQSASPSAIRRLHIANDQIDVRPILSQVRRPTLIVHRRGDGAVHYANGRYLADHIPSSTYLELPGNSHLPPEGDADSIVDAIAQFSAAEGKGLQRGSEERWLATVLFTDIVSSSELATKIGDLAWRNLQRQFYAVGQTALTTYRGREIDTAGDGLFAIFDGPARAVRSATQMVTAAKGIGIDLRAGLHTGEVEPSGDKVSGLAVHVGARVMAHANGGEILVSNTVKDLVAGSGIQFEAKGVHTLKGLPGEWPLYRALA